MDAVTSGLIVKIIVPNKRNIVYNTNFHLNDFRYESIHFNRTLLECSKSGLPSPNEGR